MRPRRYEEKIMIFISSMSWSNGGFNHRNFFDSLLRQYLRFGVSYCIYEFNDNIPLKWSQGDTEITDNSITVVFASSWGNDVAAGELNHQTR